MTDQTRWGIDMVQQENKHRMYEEQKEMRKKLSKFVLTCSVFNLQKLNEEMKRLEKN